MEVTAPQPDAGPDLDVAGIASAVQACPLVDGLHAGRHGRIATPVGDGRQVGVLVAGTGLVVGVVSRPGASTDDVAAQVRSTLSTHVPGFQVTVSVRDG